MEKIPFTSYDFWAYLSAGFLLLFVADQVAGTELLARDSWTIFQGLVAVTSAYVIGQLIASLSAQVFERLLVGKVIGFPSTVVFGHSTAPKWLRVCMSGYYKALPEETIAQISKKAAKEGITAPGEGMFWVAYAHARSDSAVMARLENFLNLYGFCRNTALVAFIDALQLYWSYYWNDGPREHFYWSIIAITVGVGMTFRYLKFFRHYAIEIFSAYAYSKDK